MLLLTAAAPNEDAVELVGCRRAPAYPTVSLRAHRSVTMIITWLPRPIPAQMYKRLQKGHTITRHKTLTKKIGSAWGVYKWMYSCSLVVLDGASTICGNGRLPRADTGASWLPRDLHLSQSPRITLTRLHIQQCRTFFTIFLTLFWGILPAVPLEAPGKMGCRWTPTFNLNTVFRSENYHNFFEESWRTYSFFCLTASVNASDFRQMPYNTLWLSIENNLPCYEKCCQLVVPQTPWSQSLAVAPRVS